MPPNPVTTAGALSKGFENPVDPNPDVGIEKLDVDGAGGGGGGETGGGLFAASNAFALNSLSSPANMIPDNVPVKNVAIGIINSKNLLSTGLIPFIGCVTKIRLYRTTKTIPKSVKPKMMPIKNFNLEFNSSVVYQIGRAHV